jgi:organic hydroperoxide reductase OsmC/OhrA
VPEHYRKQLLKVQKRLEQATKVSERTVRRSLGEHKKHEPQGTSFCSHGKTHKVPKRVTDIDDFDKSVHLAHNSCILSERKNVANYL